MMNMQLLNRSGLAAIAAATALLSTPAMAQEAALATDPAPIVADEPVTIEPLPIPEATTDTLAPVAATAAPPSSRTVRTTRSAITPTGRAIAPIARDVAPTASTPLAVAAPVEQALPQANTAMVAPLPEPDAVAPVAPASNSVIDSDMLPIAGAAGLGVLALAGAGFVMRRRRRTDDGVMVQDEWHEPVMPRPAPAAVAPANAPVSVSAFDWGSSPATAVPALVTDTSVNRIEVAKRGPTPDNPSLSLKKRLKRAAFFDQRDRQIAAGKGTPIAATAGLPASMAADVVTPPRQPVRRRVEGMPMSLGKTLQPA